MTGPVGNELPDHPESGDDECLAAEQRLWDMLAATGFEGPLYSQLCDPLIRGALDSVSRALRSGAIFAACRRMSPPRLLYPPESWSEEHRWDVAAETVTKALADFTKLARAGAGWKPDRGTMAQYMYGLCVGAFPNAFRRWRTSQRDELQFPRANPSDLEPEVPDPQAENGRGTDLKLFINQLPDPQANVIWLKVQGLTNREIATKLKLTEPQVKNALSRARDSIRNWESCNE